MQGTTLKIVLPNILGLSLLELSLNWV